MDCGWRNPEWVANNHFECLKSLRSNKDRIERAAPPQTSGMRDVLSLSAMMISFELTSNVRAIVMRIISRFAPSFLKLRHYPNASPPLLAASATGYIKTFAPSPLRSL
jgi:hypothetical protein